ncbi:MAG TPA: YDG domain-containing protein [Steroidobacteraceae bacterium]
MTINTYHAGGLTGKNAGTVSDSYATGNVTGTDHIGGLVAANYGTVTNSYATGNVSGRNNVGGLVGNNSNIVSNSYATGTVTGTGPNPGGLCGACSGTVTNSYYNIDTAGLSNVAQYGIYNSQFQNWVAGGYAALDIADYSASLTLSGGYYQIGSVQGLKDMLAFAGTANPAYKFAFSADIDLATLPAGYAIPRFAAPELDGARHVLSNFTIDNSSSNNVGFIGTLATGSSVSNVGLSNFDVTGNINVGALVGWNQGTVTNSYATGSVSGSTYAGGLVGRNDVTVTTSHAAVNVSGSNIGGLVGWNNNTISSSYATGTVSGSDGVGGLVGRNESTISNSYAAGAVTGSGDNVGGLVGFNNAGTISNAYATGVVTGTSANVGGLVGSNFMGTISNSYATGAVTGGNYAGGLVGKNLGGNGGYGYGYTGGAGDASSISNSYAMGAVSGGNSVGGLVGGNIGGTGGDAADDSGTPGTGGAGGSATITTSFSTGTVSGSSFVGGLVGRNVTGGTGNNYGGGSVGGSGGLAGANNSFWNTTTSAQGSSAAGSGLTTTQMQTASNFTGFNFTTTAGATGNNWVVVNTLGGLNSGTAATTPMLASEYSTSINNTHQLQLMAMNLAGNYSLGQDIDASVTGATTDVWLGSTFIPVGTVGTQFTNTFDGLGHTISGLTINEASASYVGMFGATAFGSSISNVGLVGGSVTAAAGSYVGSLVGRSGGAISNSFATTNVSTGSYAGGLVGYTLSGSTIDNSYAGGAVAGVRAAGLVGRNEGAVSNSYATGAATGGVNGGLIGLNSGGVVTNSFWDKTTSGLNTSAAGTGMTTADMQTQANFTSATAANGNVNPGWDLASTWVMYEGHTSPLLRSFLTPLTVTANSIVKTYDGLGSVGSGISYSTAPNGNLLGTFDYGGAKNVGVYNPGGLYSNQQGYLITYVHGSLTVNQANLTLSTSNVSKTYDGGSTAAGTATVTSGTLFGSDAISGGTFAFTDKNAGTGNKTVTVSGITVSDGNGGGNYNVTYANNTTSTISQADLTLSSADVSKTYDGGLSAAGTVTITGGTLFGSDSLSGGSFAFTDKNVGSSDKSVATSGVTINDGNGGDNYNVIYANNTTSTISQADLTLSTGNVSKTYDGGLSAAGTATITSGTLDGSDSLSGGIFAFTDKNAGAGNKTVTASGITINDGNGGGNYSVSYVDNTTSTITPKTLTITGQTAADRVYDGTAAATLVGGSLAGVIDGDDVALLTSGAFATPDVGTDIAVTAANSLEGAAAGNYNVTQPLGLSANITAAPVVVIDPPAIAPQTQNAIASAVSITAPLQVSGGRVDLQTSPSWVAGEPSSEGSSATAPSGAGSPAQPNSAGASAGVWLGLNLTVVDGGVNLPQGSQPTDTGGAGR